jgi:hypothetical protein
MKAKNSNYEKPWRLPEPIQAFLLKYISTYYHGDLHGFGVGYGQVNITNNTSWLVKFDVLSCRSVFTYTEGGKGYFREPWMVNIRSREMLDFSVVKCDLFYSREAWLSIKMLREMRIKVSVSRTAILLCLFRSIL